MYELHSTCVCIFYTFVRYLQEGRLCAKWLLSILHVLSHTSLLLGSVYLLESFLTRGK